VSGALLLYFTVSAFGLSRFEKKSNNGGIELFISWFCLLFWCYKFQNSKELSFGDKLLTLIVLVYSVYSFEREPIFFILLNFLFRIKKKISTVKLVGLACLAIVIFAYWKPFYNAVLLRGNVSDFYLMTQAKTFQFSSLDPLSSFTLIYDYFDSSPYIYEDAYFSYFTGPFKHTARMLGDRDILSLSETAKTYYTNDEYGMAFSMILESLLNFSFLGPAIVAILFFLLYTTLKKYFISYGFTIDIILIMFMLTFVRSEVMVVIKVFLIPACVFLIVTRMLHSRIVRA